MQSIAYPQYRKYKNEKGYFKIISADEWEEIQIIGSKIVVSSFKVNIFPDRIFINDLTFDYENNWALIKEAEYEKVKKEFNK
jgi:hypothetical protein